MTEPKANPRPDASASTAGSSEAPKGQRHARETPSEGPADLNKKRDEVLRSFVKKGVELAEELMHENEELAARVQALEEENASLRSHIASDDAMRELSKQIERLEAERRALMSRSHELEQRHRQESGRYREVEQELNDLASLYVASTQLSGTLKAKRVVRHVCELLEQLVGCQAAVLYVLDAEARNAMPIASFGMKTPVLRLSLQGGRVADACLTGILRMSELPRARATDEPIAVVPLVFGEQTVGLINVFELLPHKTRWDAVDQELFNLLRSQASSALVASASYEGTGGARSVVARLASSVSEHRGAGQRALVAEGSE